MSPRRLFAAAILASAAALAGCGPDYSRTDIPTTGVIAPPGGEITYQHVVVPQGLILKAHIQSFNSDGDEMGNEVRSTDPSVMDAAYVVTDHDWAFLGNELGKTTIEVKANGETVLVLDAVVVEQPPPDEFADQS
jgi:hypothetical protein